MYEVCRCSNKVPVALIFDPCLAPAITSCTWRKLILMNEYMAFMVQKEVKNEIIEVIFAE